MPDENFSWSLDLEGIALKGKKNKKAQAVPLIIKEEHTKPAVEVSKETKLMIHNSIEISMTKIDKLNKGIKNSKNNCFMNVCLQSLLSTPPFFNMLNKLGENMEIIQSLDSNSLLS